MRSLVIYESLWGNTEQVAHAIAAGLGETFTVEVVEVSAAPAAPPDDMDLLVVGGPTHAFSMSRPDTRSEAVKRGASNTAPGPGIREWVANLPTAIDGSPMASFDTRVEKVRRLPGSAARKAGKLLRRLGYAQILDPQSFYVADVEGPLLDGELERSRVWGQRLGEAARGHRQARPR
ncbi:MAG: flavodoxin domain-containing protein [Terracoccus sp.]